MAKKAEEVENKDLAVKPEAALPIALADLEAMSGFGFEEASKDSYAIPFLRILQSNSPQVEEEGPAYVEGAKIGMLMNSVTNYLFGKEVTVIAIHYQRDFVEWKPNRGGFVKSHGNDPRILERITHVDEKNNSILDNGNVIQDTRNHYLLIAEMLWLGPIIMSLTSTGIRHSKKWMSQMTSLVLPGSNKTAPMFAGVWKLRTVRNQNDDGSWYQFGDKTTTGIDFVSFVNKEQLDAALAARELITSGDAVADYDSTIDKREKSDSSNGGGWGSDPNYPEAGGFSNDDMGDDPF